MQNRLVISRMRISTLLSVLLAGFVLGACSNHVDRYDRPSGSYGKSNLPSGNGGYRKTGKPYQIAGRTYVPLESAYGYDETGVGSWYGRDFHGKLTANGENYDMHALSAAHKTLPLPTLVRVTNLENNRSVVVRVNDRGPFVKERIIDLSYAAAHALGYDQQGTARVRVQALDGRSSYASRPVSPILPEPVRPVAVTRPPAAPPPIEPAADTQRVANQPAVPGMYIQLGAFGEASNADRLRASLSTEYPSVRVQPFMSNMRRLYRVRIGPYTDVRNIERNVMQLEQQGYRNAIVIIE